jgi:two-component system KDP operon response regulator KdpE
LAPVGGGDVIEQRRVRIVTTRPDGLVDLRQALSEAGFVVDTSEDLSAAALNGVDLVVADVAGGASWSIVERADGARLIVVVSSPSDMRQGFTLGADDCVLTDAHPDEVAARSEAVMRRTRERPSSRSEPAVYVDRRLWINFDSRQVWVAGSPVHLTPREFRLLRFLVQHREDTVGHDRILAAVWSRPTVRERPTEVLKQYVWRLRQKLEEDPNAPDTIITESGEGYRFIAHPA